jgi:hypothetical protein
MLSAMIGERVDTKHRPHLSGLPTVLYYSALGTVFVLNPLTISLEQGTGASRMLHNKRLLSDGFTLVSEFIKSRSRVLLGKYHLTILLHIPNCLNYNTLI